MRNYLYIWNDPDKNRLILSGVEYIDMIPLLSNRNILLLRSNGLDSYDCDVSRFEYLDEEQKIESFKEDVNFGDYYWLDFERHSPSSLNKNEISQLLYANHMRSDFFSDCFFKSLKNDYVYQGHDDGFYLALYYRNKNIAKKAASHFLELSNNKILTIETVLNSNLSYWITNEDILELEKTHDIDHIMNNLIK